MEIKSLDAIARYAPGHFVRQRVWETPDLHCNIYNFEPGQKNPCHRHPLSTEVVVCIEGEGEVLVGSERRPIRARDTLVVSKDVAHEYVNTGTGRMTILVVQTPLPCEHVPVKV